MPIFDVLTINHKQLALVTIAKRQMQVVNVIDDDSILKGYSKWRTYIRKQIKNNKSFTSTAVQHVFE
jgi:hypothetical protein